MYKALMIFSILAGLFFTAAGQSAGQQLAAVQAQRMKDSLGLTTVQKDSIYQINLRLLTEKQQLRSQYATDPSLLRTKTQEVENTRDERYEAILSEAQYLLYKQKKQQLLRAG